MNAAYVMASNVARAFSCDGWPMRIRGVEGGGAAEDLPLHPFQGNSGQLGSTRSVEVLINDRRELELVHSGFNVIHWIRDATPAFLTAQTLQKPAAHDDRHAAVSAHLGAQLPYLLVLCRFVQHMRCMIRDSASVPTETADLERWLGDWLAGYVSAAGSTAAGVDRQRPLVAAQVHLEQRPSQRRCVHAQLCLQPRDQLQDFGAWVEIDFELALA
jgi:type VI secretion system protein ImpC